MTGPAYPMPRPDADDLFTVDLVDDVADAISSHGYPTLRDQDRIELGQILYRFLYAEAAQR